MIPLLRANGEEVGGREKRLRIFKYKNGWYEWSFMFAIQSKF